jgi:hypothetical protein
MMKKTTLFILFTIFSFVTIQAIALPKNSIYRTYYASANYEIEVGVYSIGCTTKNFRAGESTQYYRDDPMTVNCSVMGSRIDSFNNCLTDPTNNFEWKDLDSDGYIEGYKNLSKCISPIWDGLSSLQHDL